MADETRQRRTLLTQADYDLLRKALVDLSDLAVLCESAERCKIDCSLYRRTIDELNEVLRAIEKEFFLQQSVE